MFKILVTTIAHYGGTHTQLTTDVVEFSTEDRAQNAIQNIQAKNQKQPDWLYQTAVYLS